jgi:hypothetical protein
MQILNGYNFENQVLTDEYEIHGLSYQEIVNFKGTECKKIYFIRCTFMSEVNFSYIKAHDLICFIDCIFNERAIFTHGTYEKGIDVKGCIFKKDVLFDWCSFNRYAKFWKSNFEGSASFNQSHVLKGENTGQNTFVFEGELNMSYCCFSSDADLTRLDIKGPAYFWRTIFMGNANFTETHFRDSAIFEGSPSDICISLLELNDAELYKQLLIKGFLKLDSESSTLKSDEKLLTSENLYAHFSEFVNCEDFEKKINEEHFNANIGALKELCQKYNRSMFNPEKANSFFLTSFSSPNDVKFYNLSLKGVYTAEIALQSVKLENIDWYYSRIFLFKKRRSIFDERVKNTTKDYKYLSQIYNKLKVTYTNMGMYEEARDFHCGELEMKRKASQSAWKSLVTLETYYKLIGYGEYAMFPFLWLMITIFGLFPFLYILINAYQHFVDSLIHTLEISAFLTSPEKNNVVLSNSTRILDGVLRILLALEVTMFLLPLKKQIDNR